MTLHDTSPRVALPVCIEVPETWAARLDYALGELLRGLGLRAEPARRGNAALYIGTEPQAAPPGALRLRASLAPLRRVPDTLARLHHGGDAWPLPVGGSDEATDGDTQRIVEADVVGSAFWWLAGVQEVGAPADVHGRFPFDGSLQHRLDAAGDGAAGGVLRPAVDAYRRWLGDALRARGVAVPGRSWGGHTWAVALTHDLDAPREQRARALAAATLRGRPIHALRRALGPDLRRRSTESLVRLGEAFGARPTVFVKTGDGAPEDIALPRRDAVMRTLLRSGRVEVGLHPSYAAWDDARRLAAERDRLASLAAAPPSLVRMHYLRWREPASTGRIGSAGFGLDSTLGFSRAPGWRRGTAQPFRLWNAAAGAVSSVWEAPLCVMDTTLAQHQRLEGEAILDALVTALHSARTAGGCATLLWHNDPGDGAAWIARLTHLRRAVEHAAANGARIAGLGDALRAWGLEPRTSGAASRQV